MKEIILQKLLELEQNENIKILYACESGSRAWGFASPDSDFDVRFIYTRNIDYYLSIADSTDVLGLPVNEVLDIGGWDIKKALKLFLKSNAPLYEWLQSPIIYRQDMAFVMELSSLMPVYFSPRSAANHYLSMATNTLRDDLQAEQVKLKRYFYALRPALACLWIIEKQGVPPMEFKPLRALITDEVIQAHISRLSDRKKDANEKAFIERVIELNDWLTQTVEYCRGKLPLLPSVRKDTLELDGVFRKYLLP
ncbi:nucleotidyltransferase domain-containing protein [Pedobacter faecalis]|uniref:nucleotidyltransferase domain-containing protein n=1 Tax=Pedobacter faecalis TaxID=3041495 RepID=UPI00254A00C3|nr:nucleotidyltransferase domain-containing protein [Pedobacter sp. ELA7]